MGFIRLKTEVKRGKEYRYYYYCIRMRSRVKDGGTGKVKSPDKLLGFSPLTGNYVAFWLWDGLDPVKYFEAYCKWHLRNDEENIYPIVTPTNIYIRAKPNSGYDCRERRWKETRNLLRKEWDYFKEFKVNWIKQAINRLANYLYHAQDAAKHTKRLHSEMGRLKDREYKENQLLYIESSSDREASYMDMYLTGIEKLVKLAPPREQERFRKAIVRQCEKLATDRHRH